ncbi:hypothetical protein ACP70R_010436 [Stipagrostis hirtigluma subsp. patula]
MAEQAMLLRSSWLAPSPRSFQDLGGEPIRWHSFTPKNQAGPLSATRGVSWGVDGCP